MLYKKFMERLGENYKEQLDYVIIKRANKKGSFV